MPTESNETDNTLGHDTTCVFVKHRTTYRSNSQQVFLACKRSFRKFETLTYLFTPLQ